MPSISSSNAVLTLSLPDLPSLSSPQQMQGFAADDIYDVPAVKSVELLMGVDGLLSGGFVFTEIPQDITLQADSASNRFFDVWYTQQVSAQDVYIANGTILLPAISTRFIQTRGFLTSYAPAPAGKKVLQPRKYQITWARIAPAVAG